MPPLQYCVSFFPIILNAVGQFSRQIEPGPGGNDCVNNYPPLKMVHRPRLGLM